MTAITWVGKNPHRSRTGRRHRESAEHLIIFLLASNINVLSKSSCHRDCSVTVLFVGCAEYHRYKNLSPKAGALLAVSLLLRRSKAFALLNYFVFLSVTWHSHQTVVRYMDQSSEQFQRQQLMDHCSSYVHGCCLLIKETFFGVVRFIQSAICNEDSMYVNLCSCL